MLKCARDGRRSGPRPLLAVVARGRKKGNESDNRLIRGLAFRLVRVGSILLAKIRLRPWLLLPNLLLELLLLPRPLGAGVLRPTRLRLLLRSERVYPTITLGLFSPRLPVEVIRDVGVDHSIGDKAKHGVKYRKMLLQWSSIVALVNHVKT